MGIKPHHIHLWFETMNRGFWLTYDLLRTVENPSLSRLTERIQTLSYALHAEEWELEETEELFKLLCYIDGVSYETLVELRNYLDLDYSSFSLYPEGMGRMIAEIRWLK